MTLLPSDAKARKAAPVALGFLDYFPLAIMAVAACSAKAGQQHTPGELRWDRTKSTDHADCLLRHMMERGTLDTDGVRHSVKVAWRAMALLQTELENELKAEVKTKPVFSCLYCTEPPDFVCGASDCPQRRHAVPASPH